MASKARWRMTGGKNFTGKATAYSETLSNLGAHLVVESAKVGAETMQHIIETSGTGYDGRLGPTGGRVDSGNMLNSVDYERSATRGASRLSGRVSRSARFGWIKRYEDYFGYQNEGFNNVNKYVESADGGPAGYTLPMNAYEPAYYAAKMYFKAGIRALTKRSWGK